jgi:hypothetical protein
VAPTAHLGMAPSSEDDTLLQAVALGLREPFGIRHTTLQLERDMTCASDCAAPGPSRNAQ